MTALSPTRLAGDFQVDTLITGAPWKENCYVVRHGPSGDVAVIDPGDNVDAIVKACAPGTVRYVLLTHGHHDHVGAAAPLCRHFNLPCHLHQAEVRTLRHAPMYALRFASKKIDAPDAVQTFDKTADLRLGGQALAVYHTPGHTPGSVCYALAGAAFTGDTLLREALGRTDLPGADAVALNASVTRLLEQLPADTLLLPGHGRAWTAAEARAWWRAAGPSQAEIR